MKVIISDIFISGLFKSLASIMLIYFLVWKIQARHQGDKDLDLSIRLIGRFSGIFCKRKSLLLKHIGSIIWRQWVTWLCFHKMYRKAINSKMTRDKFWNLAQIAQTHENTPMFVIKQIRSISSSIEAIKEIESILLILSVTEDIISQGRNVAYFNEVREKLTTQLSCVYRNDIE